MNLLNQFAVFAAPGQVAWLEAIKKKWTLAGIDAPAFAWTVAIVLILFSLAMVARLVYISVRINRSIEKARRELVALQRTNVRRPNAGASLSELDAVNRVFENRTAAGLLPSWLLFRSAAVRDNGAETEQYFASDSAAETFTADAVVGPQMNVSFFSALPGIITGIGLLVTFTAILIALLDVRLQGTKVEGLDTLIEGLSGKFLSSISALLCATILIAVEKRRLHTIDRTRKNLIGVIDTLVPRLTSTQVLMRMQRHMDEQALAFRSFNSDLALTLKKGVSEGVAPTMERMVASIEDLNTHLRAAEANKTDSLSTQLGSMLMELQRSLGESLQEMGKSFQASLSGGAMSQFDRVAESVGGTAKVLEGMNAKFESTQENMQQLVRFAQASAQEQVALGKSQVEELSAVLRELMENMRYEASTSTANMTAALAGVVDDLSTKVAALSNELAATVTDASGKATAAASGVVARMDTWSAKNEEQIAAMMKRHSEQLDRVVELRKGLESATESFRKVVSDSSGFLTTLRSLNADGAATALGIKTAVQQISETQTGLQQVAKLTASQAERLDSAVKAQQQAWSQMQGGLGAYQQVFRSVEEASAELLEQIGSQTERYTTLTRDHFDTMIKMSNEVLSEAVSRLGGTIDELGEHLNDLSEVFETNRTSLRRPGAH